MRQEEKYGTTAEGARDSTRKKRNVLTSPVLWVLVAIVVAALVVLPLW